MLKRERKISIFVEQERLRFLACGRSIKNSVSTIDSKNMKVIFTPLTLANNFFINITQIIQENYMHTFFNHIYKQYLQGGKSLNSAKGHQLCKNEKIVQLLQISFHCVHFISTC